MTFLDKIWSKIYHSTNSGTLTGNELRKKRENLEEDPVYQAKKKEAEIIKRLEK